MTPEEKFKLIKRNTAEIVTEEYPVPIKRVGILDRFAETGPYDALLDKYGMSIDDIVSASLEAVKIKK